jgi:hypothetical protein
VKAPKSFSSFIIVQQGSCHRTDRLATTSTFPVRLQFRDFHPASGPRWRLVYAARHYTSPKVVDFEDVGSRAGPANEGVEMIHNMPRVLHNNFFLF